MNQAIELELTFLAKRIPSEIEGATPTRIVDIYIPDTSEHSHLRLRQKGDQYELTKKTPIQDGDASAQLEQTISLSQLEFEVMAVISQKRVVKDRYRVMLGNREAEVDVFRDKLQGLVVIDFEFTTPAEKARFVAPADVVLADITQEDFIAGGLLAGKSYADIEPELARFDYQRL